MHHLVMASNPIMNPSLLNLRPKSRRLLNDDAFHGAMKLFRLMLMAYSILVIFSPLHGAETWHTFTDIRDRKMVAKIINVGHDFVVLELKANGTQHAIKFDSLSEEDVEFLQNYDPDTAAEPTKPDAEQAEIDANKRLYPRTKEEIRAGIRAIKSSDPTEEISAKTHDAVIALNIFRFLSGVSHDVQGDAKFSENATDAANACKKNGGLSHDLGHSTDRCNLSGGGSMEDSVRSYMEDSGENNRERRGHRAWCLNPPMGKVGFGSAGDSYSAMWCMDGSGKGKTPEFWSYPGQGFYPQEYVFGNAWSVYFQEKIDDLNKVNVEVFRLTKRPEKALPMHGLIDGHVVPILHKSNSMLNGINFEPEEPTRKGIYWIRVTGGGARYGYVVELF